MKYNALVGEVHDAHQFHLQCSTLRPKIGFKIKIRF